VKTRTLAWIVLLFWASAEVASAQSAKRPPRKGRAYAVTIDSAPQQATIYLDGKEYGTVGYTPYTGRLVGGDYKLILEVPGYKPLERTISVGAQKHEFFYTMERTNGTLDVRGDADPNLVGAQVYVNGEVKGTVPASIPVAEGRVLVEIKKPGFADLAQWTEVKAGERVTLAPQLKAQANKGGLLIDADVPNAQVSVDGREIADTTPAIVDNLDAGPHVVEVRKPPAQPWRTTVDVKPNARVKVTAELGKGGGTVRVLSNREDAEVWLDGDPKGKPPLDLTAIPPGIHLVEVRAKGFKTREERVTIQGGQSSVLKLDLVDKAVVAGAGKLRVISPVPEAAVFIDGAPVGNAPLELDLGAGMHYVMVQKPGFAKFEKQVTVEEGKLAAVTAELQSSGGVRFIANVEDAEVLVDGKPVGRTPLTLETIDSGDHVVTIRRTGFAAYNERVRVEGGQLTVVNAVLAEDPTKIKRGLSTWGANTIPAGRFAVDAGTGYPYYIQLRAIAGVTESKFLSWDFGLEFRSLGLLGTWEFMATGRVRLLQITPFALAAFASVGGGGGSYSGRGEFTLQGGAIGTMQMTNILSISAKGWFDFWSDRLCKDPAAGSAVSDNGPDICQGIGTPAEKQRALDLTGGNIYSRDAGLRFYLSLVVEAALTENVSFYVIFEGAPFQNERAGHTSVFTPSLLSDSDPIYNGRVGLTFKF
jgi:hypothetical protein